MFEEFKNKKWYRQGGLVVPFFENPAMLAIAGIIGPTNYVGIYRAEKNHGYFNKQEFKEGAYAHIKAQLKDIKHVDELYLKWKKYALKALELVERSIKDNYSKDSITRLIMSLEDFWRTAWVIEFYDAYGEQITNENFDLSSDEIAVLFSPTFIPKMQEEYLELLKLALEDGDIENHYKEFYFIKASWADASEYSVDEIKEKLNELKKKSKEELKVEIHKIEGHYSDINKRKLEIGKKLSEDQKKIAYFFEKLTEWRDERKVYVQKCNCHLQKFLLKLEKEHNIPLKYLKFVNYYQFQINPEKELDLELLKKRHEFCVDLSLCDHWTYLHGDEAKALAEIVEKEFSSDAKEVKGMCACRGHVTGKVCVVMNTKEFGDFKEGNVLVTACTRPEFAPLMKKAIAIVTDEGGITSHAAIVSRELAIPCVIGTQKATSIFKNGMTVEVDADNGIVKIV